MRRFNRRALLQGIPLAAAGSAAAATTKDPNSNRKSVRIGLAALRRGNTIAEGVEKIAAALAECRDKGVEIACFPETYLPGLRGGKNPGYTLSAPVQPAMEKALRSISAAAERNKVSAVVGLEWVSTLGLENRAYVFSSKGEVLGYQTKNQIMPGG